MTGGVGARPGEGRVLSGTATMRCAAALDKRGRCAEDVNSSCHCRGSLVTAPTNSSCEFPAPGKAVRIAVGMVSAYVFECEGIGRPHV